MAVSAFGLFVLNVRYPEIVCLYWPSSPRLARLLTTIIAFASLPQEPCQLVALEGGQIHDTSLGLKCEAFSAFRETHQLPGETHGTTQAQEDTRDAEKVPTARNELTKPFSSAPLFLPRRES